MPKVKQMWVNSTAYQRCLQTIYSRLGPEMIKILWEKVSKSNLMIEKVNCNIIHLKTKFEDKEGAWQ